mgnify:CR=1 FL=1
MVKQQQGSSETSRGRGTQAGEEQQRRRRLQQLGARLQQLHQQLRFACMCPALPQQSLLFSASCRPGWHVQTRLYRDLSACRTKLVLQCSCFCMQLCQLLNLVLLLYLRQQANKATLVCDSTQPNGSCSTEGDTRLCHMHASKLCTVPHSYEVAMSPTQ